MIDRHLHRPQQLSESTHTRELTPGMLELVPAPRDVPGVACGARPDQLKVPVRNEPLSRQKASTHVAACLPFAGELTTSLTVRKREPRADGRQIERRRTHESTTAPLTSKSTIRDSGNARYFVGLK